MKEMEEKTLVWVEPQRKLREVIKHESSEDCIALEERERKKKRAERN